MSKARAALRFLLDWRNIATLLATVIVALIVVTYIDNVRARVEATSALRAEVAQSDDLRKTATRRIDLLSKQINQLQADLSAAEEGRAAIRAQLDALIAQLRQLGAEPVVTPAPSDSHPPANSPSPTTTPTPTRTSRPSQKPTPTPSRTPSPTCTPLPVLNRCTH